MRLIFLLSIIIPVLNSGIKNIPAPPANTANIDGVTYKAILYGDQSISIKAGDKTVLHIKRADLYLTFEPLARFEFKDVNGDGYPDLVIEYKSTVPGKSDLVLYDKHSKKFVQVSGFPGYPASTRIPNTSTYYSYQTSGCADKDWDSKLFKIVNYKIIDLGSITGRGCDNAPEALGVSVYKKTGKKEHLIKKLPITGLSKYNNDKKALVNDYWKVNYKEF